MQRLKKKGSYITGDDELAEGDDGDVNGDGIGDAIDGDGEEYASVLDSENDGDEGDDDKLDELNLFVKLRGKVPINISKREKMAVNQGRFTMFAVRVNKLHYDGM